MCGTATSSRSVTIFRCPPKCRLACEPRGRIQKADHDRRGSINQRETERTRARGAMIPMVTKTVIVGVAIAAAYVSHASYAHRQALLRANWENPVTAP